MVSESKLDYWAQAPSNGKTDLHTRHFLACFELGFSLGRMTRGDKLVFAVSSIEDCGDRENHGGFMVLHRQEFFPRECRSTPRTGLLRDSLALHSCLEYPSSAKLIAAFLEDSSIADVP